MQTTAAKVIRSYHRVDLRFHFVNKKNKNIIKVSNQLFFSTRLSHTYSHILFLMHQRRLMLSGQ